MDGVVALVVLRDAKGERTGVAAVDAGTLTKRDDGDWQQLTNRLSLRHPPIADADVLWLSNTEARQVGRVAKALRKRAEQQGATPRTDTEDQVNRMVRKWTRDLVRVLNSRDSGG